MSDTSALKLRYFLLGITFSAMLVLITAASNTPPAPNYGRYQISSWAGQIGPEAGSIGAFVIDTATGETKTVYSRTYGNAGSSKVEKNNLKTSFAAME